MTDLNKKWQQLRRYGIILEREDTEFDGGWYTEFWLESEKGINYKCVMKNGEVLSLKPTKY